MAIVGIFSPYEREGGDVIRFTGEARHRFDEADEITKVDAQPILELLSAGFEIPWFQQVKARLWQASAKPLPTTQEHFGLGLECFVIGNGFQKDFHQVTLLQDPPAKIADRMDPGVRFVASDAPLAEASCAAWAATRRMRIVLLRKKPQEVLNETDHLYQLLSSSLWRRDLFSESEPVRLATEFFGRESMVNEVLAKIIAGSPVAVFGLRKIGKSSLLGRTEDLLDADENSVSITAFLSANSSRFKSGRWWDLALELISIWQNKLQRLAARSGSKIHPKAERLRDAVVKKTTDTSQLARAFEKDLLVLIRCAQQLKSELQRDSVRLVAFIDECDHIYPQFADAGHWRSDFFVLWNTVQGTKRQLENPAEFVYVLGGVNPSGVEQGSLCDQPNPLFETQKVYLPPMTRSEAAALYRGIGGRMGLSFADEAVEAAFERVGGHPLLLRKLGSAIHAADAKRSKSKAITADTVDRAFSRNKREFYSHVTWILDHLKKVAPDEEKLLRDVALGGTQTYLDVWGDNEYRETFAHHLEKYGLISFEDDIPLVTLPLIKDALQKPTASEFDEQKKQLAGLVEAIEQSLRARLALDLGAGLTPSEAIEEIVKAIPGDAKNRALDRQALRDVGEAAGIEAVIENLNWGDYEILMNKFYERVEWIGEPVAKEERLAVIKKVFADAHLVRHSNNTALRAAIAKEGFAAMYSRFSKIRDTMSG